MLFFGTLHSNGFIFPFLLCLSCLFFSRLFVRPPQTTILPFCISFPSSIQINLQELPLSHPKVCLPRFRESQKVSHSAGSESLFSERLSCPSCQVHFHMVCAQACAKLHSLCHSLSHSRDHHSLSDVIVRTVGPLCHWPHRASAALREFTGVVGMPSEAGELSGPPFYGPLPKDGYGSVSRHSLRLTSRLHSQELEIKFDPENLKKKRQILLQQNLELVQIREPRKMAS